MSLSVPTYSVPLDDEPVDFHPLEVDAAVKSMERSKYQALFFLPAVTAAALSALTGGAAELTDLAWLIATVLCVIFLVAEMRAFSFRWGIGGLLLYGGSLVWVCYDYMNHWFANGPYRQLFTTDEGTLARATLGVMVFIPCMALGMQIRLRGALERTLARLPGPRTPRLWLAIAVACFLIGLIPYAFFTRDGLISAMWNDIFAGRGGGGAQWTVGRTGNANYSYGAYLAQVLQVGTMGSILGAYYAIMVTRSWAGRVCGILLWLPAVALGFGTGSRNSLITAMLPAIGFLFLRYQAEAAYQLKRVSVRGYLILAAMLAVVLVLVQIQITFRNQSFRDADLDKVSVTKLEGNAMFSESLAGYAAIPRIRAPLFSTFPGESVLRPIPDKIFWFFVTPLPRAIWTTKPIDPATRWYNSLVGHSSDGIEGTTISSGLVGHWYIRYGFAGVVEGGLIMGFLMGVAERLLRNFPHAPLRVVTSLGLATCIFRSFRGLEWLDYHSTMVGLAGLCIMYLVLRIFISDNPAEQPVE